LDLGHELRTPLTSILLAVTFNHVLFIFGFFFKTKKPHKVNEINEIVHHDVQRNDSKQQHDTLLRVISVSAKTLLALINDQLDMGAVWGLGVVL
jgi:signal transduction histidine kinase